MHTETFELYRDSFVPPTEQTKKLRSENVQVVTRQEMEGGFTARLPGSQKDSVFPPHRQR